jgi:hypothetical protein
MSSKQNKASDVEIVTDDNMEAQEICCECPVECFVPANVQVAGNALRSLYRSMRLEHKEVASKTLGEEYGENGEASSEAVARCRELSPMEEAMRDACCEAIIDFVRDQQSACL